MTRCAYQSCGAEFTSADPRKLYHSPECKRAALVAKRFPNCVNCQKKPNTPGERFCSHACQWSYIQRRRGGRPHKRLVAVSVLLPAGCNPEQTSAPPASSHDVHGAGTAYGEVARKVWCRRYERCLAFAVAKNWGGFGCQKCEVDEPDIELPKPKNTNWEF